MPTRLAISWDSHIDRQTVGKTHSTEANWFLQIETILGTLSDSQEGRCGCYWCGVLSWQVFQWPTDITYIIRGPCVSREPEGRRNIHRPGQVRFTSQVSCRVAAQFTIPCSAVTVRQWVQCSAGQFELWMFVIICRWRVTYGMDWMDGAHWWWGDAWRPWGVCDWADFCRCTRTHTLSIDTHTAIESRVFILRSSSSSCRSAVENGKIIMHLGQDNSLDTAGEESLQLSFPRILRSSHSNPPDRACKDRSSIARWSMDLHGKQLPCTAAVGEIGIECWIQHRHIDIHLPYTDRSLVAQLNCNLLAFKCYPSTRAGLDLTWARPVKWLTALTASIVGDRAAYCTSIYCRLARSPFDHLHPTDQCSDQCLFVYRSFLVSNIYFIAILANDLHKVKHRWMHFKWPKQ